MDQRAFMDVSSTHPSNGEGETTSPDDGLAGDPAVRLEAGGGEILADPSPDENQRSPDSGHTSATLLPLLYQELRKLAGYRMAAEAEGHTLQATALAHEAWLRLSGDGAREWKNREHFLAAAAQAMRLILVDWARRKGRVRYGGKWERIPLDQVSIAANDTEEIVMRIDDALNGLAQIAPEEARLVELRYFCGLTVEEASEAMGISRATANRQWAFAKAWLYQHLSSEA